MVKSLSEKAVKELIEQALSDDSIPAYARTLIQILLQQQETLEKEHKVLKRILGPRYERALRKGPYLFLSEFVFFKPFRLVHFPIDIF